MKHAIIMFRSGPVMTTYRDAGGGFLLAPQGTFRKDGCRWVWIADNKTELVPIPDECICAAADWVDAKSFE